MADARAVARLSDPTMTGMICEPLGATPQRASIVLFVNSIRAASCSRRCGSSGAKPQRGANRRGDDRRGRGREDEGPRIVHHEIAHDLRAADERAGGAERLSACVQREDVWPPLQPRAEPAAIRPENAGGVSLVDDEHALVAVGDGGEVLKRRAVAVHAVEAFDGDPGAAACSRPLSRRGSCPRPRWRRCARLPRFPPRPARMPS